MSATRRAWTPRYRQGIATALFGLAVATASFAGEPAPERGHVVPSETCRGIWIVPIAFGEDPSLTLRLVLDTGAVPTAVDPDSIERVTGRRVRPGKRARLRNGTAGPLRFRSMRVKVHEMDSLSRALGTPIDGILGVRPFRDRLLTLDYPAAEVRVAGGALPTPDGETIFEDVGEVRPHLRVEVGGQPVPVLVDSGATGGLTLRQGDGIEWETPPRATSGSVRFKSIEINYTGRASDVLAFGPLALERPVVEVTKNGSRLAGWKILRRFAWTFDARNSRIRMLPDSAEPIRSEPARGSGLVFRPRNAGLEVARVLEGMPAERAGVREGDLVIAIDGTPIYSRGCRSMQDDAAATRTLTVRRDGETREFVVPMGVLVP